MSHFNGPEYKTIDDHVRLTNQLATIKALMLDGKWRTLAEIESITAYPSASISAQLRHLRKKRFGSFLVQRRSRGDRAGGLYEYKVMEPATMVAQVLPPKPRCLFEED